MCYVGKQAQGKMEKTGCKIICGAPTTLAVKGLMMMMMMMIKNKTKTKSETKLTASVLKKDQHTQKDEKIFLFN